MRLPRLRNPLLLSPPLAIIIQLAVSAVAAAATGGGDFPRFRHLLPPL